MALSDLPCVIFDLGGVLLNWDTPAITRTVFPADPDFSLVHREVFAHSDWLEMDRGDLTEAAAVERFVARTGKPRKAMEELMDEVRKGLAPLPASLRLLEELAALGVPLYCLSNMHASNTQYLTERYDFFAHFRDVVFSALVNLMKPEPAIYELAARRFGVAPGHCVFVDDSSANVAAARAAGWQAIRFTDAAACRQQLQAVAARQRD
jgi:putative hydrolase of the HAD superfamily